MAEASLVELRNVTKAYPGVVALQGLDLDIHGREVHAIVGLNGAGKSTLVNLLAGLIRPDGGSIRFPRSHDPRLGEVGLVPQEILVVPGMSIGRNIMLGHEPALVRRRLNQQALDSVSAVLSRVGLGLHPETDPAECSAPQLRLVQIAKALLAPGKVMLLDEPTAVLPASDTDRLLDRIAMLRDEGEAVVYVTHRLGEVVRLADVVTVLKDGKKVASLRRGQFDRDGLIRLLSKEGRLGPEPALGRSPLDRSVAIEISDLSASGFEGLSLSAAGGEVTALVGLQDAGQSRVVKCLAGLNPPTSGTVRIDEKLVDLATATSASGSGLTFVPADRRTSGVVGSMTVRENTVLSPRSRARWLGWRLQRAEQHAAEFYIGRFGIKARSSYLVANLSGGNQQKVALARALEARPRVLLLDEPTQGIDAATKGDVLRLIKADARSSSRAVIASTSQLEEVPGWADHAIVFREGRVVGHLSGEDVTESALLELSVT